MILRAAAVLLAVGLAACSTTRHCEGEFDYQQARTLPPPASVDGLKWPQSPSALQIPPPPPTTVPFASPVADEKNPGEQRIECLDTPPRLPPPPPTPAAEPAKTPATPAKS